MRTKVRVVIVADIDLDEYRAEYSRPEQKAESIKNTVREDILEAARSAYPVATYGGMVRISEAHRG